MSDIFSSSSFFFFFFLWESFTAIILKVSQKTAPVSEPNSRVSALGDLILICD